MNCGESGAAVTSTTSLPVANSSGMLMFIRPATSTVTPFKTYFRNPADSTVRRYCPGWTLGNT